MKRKNLIIGLIQNCFDCIVGVNYEDKFAMVEYSKQKYFYNDIPIISFAYDYIGIGQKNEDMETIYYKDIKEKDLSDILQILTFEINIKEHIEDNIYVHYKLRNINELLKYLKSKQ